VRSGIAAAKQAAEENDGIALYKALLKDLLDRLGSFSDTKDYLGAVMMIARFQQLIDKNGVGSDDTLFEEATAFMEATQAKMAAMEQNTYQEYVEDDGDEE
jgi:hypothetical protein